jgi:hypothetical protein
MLRFMPLAAMHLGCGAGESKSSEPTVIQDDGDLIHLEDEERDTANPLDCQSVTMKINGRAPEDTEDPMVGDHWMVRLYCDGVVMHGANRLYFEPGSLAEVEDYNTDADFVGTGEGQMTMQSGSERMVIQLTVHEAP